MRLQERVAVITGAGAGLGRAIAKRYAREGARVVILDLSLAAAETVARDILAGGGTALGVAADVTDEQQVEAAVAASIAKFGQIDILVNNAGIQIVKPVQDFSYAEWKRVLAVHLDGAFLATRACIKHMYAQRRGCIIYMGSVHSHEASKLKAPYVAAKHGLLGLARVVAKEGAEYNVRANVICPGYVRTELVERQIPEQAQRLGISEDAVIRNVMLGGTVDGEFTTEADIAELALLFASFETNALTGQSLTASHGWSMI